MQEKLHDGLRESLHGSLLDLLQPSRPFPPPWVSDEQKYYPDLDYSWQRLPTAARVTFPKVTDVAVNSMFRPTDNVLLTGEDGQLWVANTFPPETIKSLGGSGLRRVAVGQHGKNVWCVDASGTLWKPGITGGWLQVQNQDQKTGPIDDIMVDGDDLWMTGQIGTMWITKDAQSFQEATVLIGFKRLAAGANGAIWGISTSGGLWWHHRPSRVWYMSNGVGMEDLSVGYEGVIWLVDQGGKVFTTKDGNSFNLNPGTGFRRIAAGRYGIVYGVKTDGSVWVWAPSPPAPQPSGGSGGGSGGSGSGGSGGTGGGTGGTGGGQTQTKPTISCNTSPPDKFSITGTGFDANKTVTIRGTSITNQLNSFYWNTQSSSTGSIQYDLIIPCLSGVVISFVATDGRSDPNDLTGNLWSNTVSSSCPV